MIDIKCIKIYNVTTKQLQKRWKPKIMSKLEKLKKRLEQIPKDFTYAEARTLLNAIGFEELSKGKTSGSRVRFYRKSDGAVIDLHKPHPNPEMKGYAVAQLAERLKEYGEL